MHSTNAFSHTGTGSLPPASSPIDELLSDLPGLVDRTSQLVQGAALALGLDARGAAQAAQTSTLMSGDKTIVILPVAQSDDGKLSLMINVQTSMPVNTGGDSTGAVALLQHVPGALHAFAAALGATPDGRWALHRTLRVAAGDAAALAAHLVETLRLADFVLSSPQQAPQDGH
jgi:hypothetical protein